MSSIMSYLSQKRDISDLVLSYKGLGLISKTKFVSALVSDVSAEIGEEVEDATLGFFGSFI